jgi:hypothetical protein
MTLLCVVVTALRSQAVQGLARLHRFFGLLTTALLLYTAFTAASVRTHASHLYLRALLPSPSPPHRRYYLQHVSLGATTCLLATALQAFVSRRTGTSSAWTSAVVYMAVLGFCTVWGVAAARHLLQPPGRPQAHPHAPKPQSDAEDDVWLGVAWGPRGPASPGLDQEGLSCPPRAALALSPSRPVAPKTGVRSAVFTPGHTRDGVSPRCSSGGAAVTPAAGKAGPRVVDNPLRWQATRPSISDGAGVGQGQPQQQLGQTQPTRDAVDAARGPPRAWEERREALPLSSDPAASRHGSGRSSQGAEGGWTTNPLLQPRTAREDVGSAPGTTPVRGATACAPSPLGIPVGAAPSPCPSPCPSPKTGPGTPGRTSYVCMCMCVGSG